MTEIINSIILTYSFGLYVFSRPAEAIPRKKLLPFGNFLKGGLVQSECKSFEVVFRGAFFWTKMWGRGGEHNPKVLR